MKLITSLLSEDREFYQATIALSEQFRANKPLPLSVNGLADGAKEAFVAELLRYASEKHPSPSLLLVSEEGAARTLAASLSAQGLTALFYPSRDFLFLNISSSHDTERERLSVLCRVLAGENITVVTTPFAALELTMPPERLRALSLRLAVGDEISPSLLAERLVDLGFARVEMVDGVGQFARRGGIFDFYPASSPAPIRLEFFGDEIDRMGYFDAITQRMTGECPLVELVPAKEVLVDSSSRADILFAHEELIKKADVDTLRALSAEKASIESGNDLLFADRYISLIYKNASTLLHYFKGMRVPVLLESEGGMEERAQTLLGALAEEGTSYVEKGMLSPRYNRFAEKYDALTAFLSEQASVYISSFGHSYNGKMAGLFGFRTRRTVSYFDKETLLLDDLKNLLSGFYRVLVLTENAAAAEAQAERLRMAGYNVVILPPDEPCDLSLLKDTVGICYGSYPSGFELLVPKIAVLSTLPDEITVRRRTRKARKNARYSAGQKIMSYADLSVGDYVVHAMHGIGRFEGMQQLRVDGVTRDYITIRYAGSDSLFLPADRLELISKYIGAKSEDGTVKLSKLGGTEWTRAKNRAKSAAEDMAKELVRLYAERQRREGFAFPPEGEMEREFADAFEFEETEPQAQAIAEIEGDMMRPVPMDRLLCGDVGFGKTEVALRAAFKAIVGGKQVAILVPTTILAMQHYQTVISRMRSFPVDVEMLSRLRTPKEQEKIRRRLERGEIDLIVGTHSLLSKTIKFKNLGLLIVDEEQRFGVRQKEKLKALATDIDVLTLTATPIPRTLNMAMSGIRDMSVLDEAPADRHPVQTYVMEHDDIIIGEAVRKELARGGQVLYLYNRVESMERPAARLAEEFPEARITIAHGKMDKEELEDIWQSLVRGEIDILVCTTIIETGVDLPNANTLIIEDADRMGLSQLHQIRGRVGRSGRHAYAYFTYRRGKALSEIADKRLKAIREYAEFGAGFKIALRDLEIRGAGNLLGAEQHGHIEAVGYDLYVKILNEAILEEKGIVKETPFEAQFDVPVDAHIPENYIRTSPERMEMYKKISLIQTAEDRSDVLDEFIDRYGEPPRAVERLLWIAAARAAASRMRIAKVEYRDGSLRFLADKPDLAVWSVLFAEYPGLKFTGAVSSAAVSYKPSKGEDAAEVLYRILSAYEKVASE